MELIVIFWSFNYLPLPFQALIFHLLLLLFWYRFFSPHLRSWFNPATTFCVLTLQEKAFMFFLSSCYFLKQLPGNKPCLTYCCPHHSPLGTRPRFICHRHWITIFCIQKISAKFFAVNYFFHTLHKLFNTFRMKRRKGQFAGRSDFGDGACSSVACGSPANGEDDHFKETQWVGCHVCQLSTVWLVYVQIMLHQFHMQKVAPSM